MRWREIDISLEPWLSTLSTLSTCRPHCQPLSTHCRPCLLSTHCRPLSTTVNLSTLSQRLCAVDHCRPLSTVDLLSTVNPCRPVDPVDHGPLSTTVDPVSTAARHMNMHTYKWTCSCSCTCQLMYVCMHLNQAVTVLAPPLLLQGRVPWAHLRQCEIDSQSPSEQLFCWMHR